MVGLSPLAEKESQLDMAVILHPTYFPSIWTGAVVAQCDDIIWEQHDNYQKQTYRNRTRILSAHGTLDLTIPVQYTQKQRQRYSDVQISDDHSWMLQHWKSISIAYSNSPFFEFYRDEMEILFSSTHTNLFEYNMTCIKTLFGLIELPFSNRFTTTFEKTFKGEDFRHLTSTKINLPEIPRYIQVFDNSIGFTPHLSLLDLLFNQGPSTKSYLLKLPLDRLIITSM